MDCIKDLQSRHPQHSRKQRPYGTLSGREPDELDDPTYIIWYDRHCEPNEDPVLRFALKMRALSCLRFEARSFGNTITVYDYDIDRIEWWKGTFMPIFWKCWSVTASAGVRPVAGRSKGSSGIVVPDAVIS